MLSEQAPLMEQPLPKSSRQPEIMPGYCWLHSSELSQVSQRAFRCIAHCSRWLVALSGRSCSGTCAAHTTTPHGLLYFLRFNHIPYSITFKDDRRRIRELTDLMPRAELKRCIASKQISALHIHLVGDAECLDGQLCELEAASLVT